MTVKIWKDVGINWSDVLPERLSKEDFLSRKVIIKLNQAKYFSKVGLSVQLDAK